MPSCLNLADTATDLYGCFSVRKGERKEKITDQMDIKIKRATFKRTPINNHYFVLPVASLSGNK